MAQGVGPKFKPQYHRKKQYIEFLLCKYRYRYDIISITSFWAYFLILKFHSILILLFLNTPKFYFFRAAFILSPSCL
jgi:hypothetical protein